MRRLLVIAMLVTAGCAKKAPPPKLDLPPDPKDELKAVIVQLYSSLEHLEPERLNDLLTADVMAFGLGPKDTFTNRDAIVESMRTELIPFGLRGDVFKLAGSSPHLELANGEQSGWFYDFPRFEQLRSEKASKFWKARVSGHVFRDEGRWRIDALHVSFGFPDAELYAADAPKKLKPPEALGVAKGDGSEPVVTLTRRMLEDIGVKVERTSDSSEVVLIGTDATDIFEGGAKFKELARPRVAALRKSGFTMKIEDGPRARLAPDRKSGWVTGSVVMRITKGGRVQVLPAFRALWLFAEEKSGWSLVSEHQSLGLTNELRQPSTAE